MSEIMYNAKMLIPVYPDTRLVVVFSLTKKDLRGENKDRGGEERGGGAGDEGEKEEHEPEGQVGRAIVLN